MIQRLLRTLDNPGALLALVVAGLLSLGLVMVYSASAARAGLEAQQVAEIRGETQAAPEEEWRGHHGTAYFVKQAIWVCLALAVGWVALIIPLDFLERIAPWILGAGLLGLAVVSFTPLGITVNGARRWASIGGLTIQPSEFAKPALVIFMAAWLAQNRERMSSLKHGFLPALGILALFCGMFMLQRDLGAIVVTGAVVVAMWCLAQMRLRYLLVLGTIALPFLLFLVFQHSYRLKRILAFFDPEKYAMTYAFQLNQSLIAVGSGGTFGAGLGQGLQKYHFLNESHTDFIFAIICEELGLVGGLSVCGLFLAIVLLGFQISYRAPDYFSGLLAAGLALMIGCAAFINFFVVLGMAPTKGLPLPFISYGGSSLLANAAAAGLLINVANYSLYRRGSREVC